MTAERLAFVDRLRGLATVAMIEVHVVNALLAPDFRGGRAFAALDFVNGLVAPSFLVAAGFSLVRSFAISPAVSFSLGSAGLALARSFAPGPAGLSLARSFAAGLPALTWPEAPTRWHLAAGHARRAALLLVLGYAMHASHLPAALSAQGPERASAWAFFLQTDVLQLIALGLSSLALVAALVRSARRYAAICLVAALACTWLGPEAHRHAWGALPMPLATFFTERYGSPFPALPWAAFLALGAALGASGPPASKPGAWARKLCLVAALGLSLGALGALAPWPLGGAYERWTLSPSATSLRAGLVCLVAAGLASASHLGRSIERLLALFGRHSLFVYVAHIVLVYGRHPLSLRSLIGPTLGPLGCLVAWAAVSVSMVLGVLALRAGRARLATRGARALAPTPRRAP